MEGMLIFNYVLKSKSIIYSTNSHFKQIFKHFKPVEEVFDKEKIVYLSPESPNTIDSIDQNKVYIIGGIVDDNQCKGLSLKKAESLGLTTAKLSIRDYLSTFNNQSLNINHSML